MENEIPRDPARRRAPIFELEISMRHDVSFAVEKRKWNGRVIEAAAATILINSDIGKVCIITVCGGRDMTR